VKSVLRRALHFHRSVLEKVSAPVKSEEQKPWV